MHYPSFLHPDVQAVAPGTSKFNAPLRSRSQINTFRTLREKDRSSTGYFAVLTKFQPDQHEDLPFRLFTFAFNHAKDTSSITPLFLL